MPARLQDAVLQRLDALIEQGSQVVQSFKKDQYGALWSTLPEQTVRAFVVAASSEVVRLAGRDSEYFRQLPPPLSDGRSLTGMETIPHTSLGVLIALRDAVAGGHLEQLATRVRSALHDDFVQQAVDLLAGDYYVAAMVIIGGVLENRLRDLCRGRNVQPVGTTLNAYNQALRDVEYTQATWRRIQVLGDLRNHAAHGQYDEVTRAQVDEELVFVQRFLAEHEA